MYDVVVVGAGPAGAMAAAKLAKMGAEVLLLHHEDARGPKIGESLPSSSQPLLRQLGIWELVERGPHLHAYGNASAWGTEKLETKDFIEDPSGYGWHLDRRRFDEDLREYAREQGARLTTARAARVRRRAQGFWNLSLAMDAANREIECGMILDASGPYGFLSREHRVFRQRDQSIMAIYAWVDAHVDDEDSRSLIEATEEGWWYTALLPGRKRVVSFHTDLDIWRATGTAAMYGRWRSALEGTQHICQVVSRDWQVMPQLAWRGSGGSNLECAVGSGWLATGDAAMTFDPICSQGIFNALYTGDLAGSTVVELLDGKADAMASYQSRLNEIRHRYLVHHRLIYTAETRWSHADFWRRRWGVDVPDHFVGSALST